MKTSPFEKFILENLYNLWKEYGTSQAKTFEAIIEEYEFKEQNIRKPLKKLISAGLVESDSTCAWLTKKGALQMQATDILDKLKTKDEGRASVKIEIRFLNKLEQAISKSELTAPEREMWLGGIKQMNQNPILLKALKKALNATIDNKN